MAGDGGSTTRVRAVIFDLDGVLVDSEIWWDDARRDFAHDHDRAWTEEDRAAVMGANSRQWSRIMRERLVLDLAPEAIERHVVEGVVGRYRSRGAPRIHGAEEAVRRIAAVLPVAVASSAHRDVIEAALDATGLGDCLSAVVSSDEVAHGKPSPDVYLEAARQLGVPPAACLVVEDSLNGVRAARAAGMTVVLVPNHSVPPAPGAADLAHVVLERLADLDPLRPGVPGGGSPRDVTSPGDAASPDGASSPAPARSRQGPRRSELPGPPIAPWRRTLRAWISRLLVWFLVRCVVRLRVEGLERLPGGPAIYCFNHLNWVDPFVVAAALPLRPRLYFFGPKEEDMGEGPRNRLMAWSGAPVPYKPGKNDLLDTTRRVRAVLDAGGVLAIAGEGRIHAHEWELLPFNEGVAYFALRSRVPIVPIAINGTSWIRVGRRVRVRVGEPIEAVGRPTREAIGDLTREAWEALHALVRDHPDYRPPGPFGRWLTELFNDWPEGRRPD